MPRIDVLAGIQLHRRSRPLCARLASAREPFDALATEIEQRFLACGRALQEQVNLTTRLSAQSRQLTELGARSDRGDTAVQRVMRVMTAHLDLSDDFAREEARLATTLAQHAQQLQRLLHDQQKLERSFAPMRVLHSFFRIESASLPAEQQALFHAVTAELRRLHAEVSVSFSGDASALIDTRRQVLAAAERLQVQSETHLATTAAKRQQVQRSLARLTTAMEHARLQNQSLAAGIVTLDRDTDRIAVSLQYQDITRQKMEHVREAADRILAAFAGRDRTPVRQRARVQQLLCQVQGGQLDAVQQELSQATEAISSGLHGLIEQLDRIERESLSVAGLDEIATEMDTAIVEVASIHQVTTELTRHALARLAEAIQTAQSFAHATTGATSTMRRIAADLLLLGLNAQVQALQAHNGCLEVLSSAVSHMSTEAGALSREFEGKLEVTTETLTRFIGRSESIYREIETRRETLAAEDDSILRDLRAEHDAHQRLVAEVGTSLQQLRRQADDLLASVDLADISRAPLAQLRELFAALGSLCADAAGNDLPPDEATLADLRSRYTMDSERLAHATALAGVGSVPIAADVPAPSRPPVPLAEPAPALATATPGESALGDNVELF